MNQFVNQIRFIYIKISVFPKLLEIPDANRQLAIKVHGFSIAEKQPGSKARNLHSNIGAGLEGDRRSWPADSGGHRA